MAKLAWTAEDTQHGRLLLSAAVESRRRADLEAFYDWMQANVIIDIAVVRSTFDKYFASGDGSRTLRLYDATMKGYSPAGQAASYLVRTAIAVVALGAVAGGFLYFIRAVFG